MICLEDLFKTLFYSGNTALTAMQLNNESQSIIITGESGAGKTESTKQILRYLCYNSKNDTAQKIMDANPIMEALGNARTEKNDNSSRYCRFLEVFSMRYIFIMQYMINLNCYYNYTT